MITSSEASAAVLSHLISAKIEAVSLDASLGRVLAEDIFADMDQPPFHRVAMDGIAISSGQLKAGLKFKVLGTVAAGTTPPPLEAGPVCYEIMTGASLPEGTDMVVRYEDLRIEDGEAGIICGPENLSQNIHARGSDYREGQKVLSAGTVVRSTTCALLASVGRSSVTVWARPHISVLSTGDELVSIDAKPLPGQIRWSNGISLQQELAAFGFTDVSVLMVRDSEEEIRRAMQECLAKSDVMLLTGGVSAGKFDFVPRLLKDCEVREIFHKVSQRPGKPLWFGRSKSTVVFGLPGNPVSCLVNLRKFVVPLLQASLGVPADPATAILAEEVGFNKNMTYYCPVKVRVEAGRLLAFPLKGNGSGDFFQLRDSDGFMELRPEQAPFKAGHVSEVYLWGRDHA